MAGGGGGGGGQDAVSYSLTLPSRTLRALPATGDGSTQWVVGTTSLREENEVRVLQYDAAQDQLATKAIWVHHEEVWDVACCPGQPGTFVTVHSKGGVSGATLWQAADGAAQLTPVAQLPHTGGVRRALWSHHDPSQVLTLEDGALHCWRVGGGAAQPAATGTPGELEQFWTAALHPRDPKQALVAAGCSVQLWDAEAMRQVGGIDVAHHVRTLDISWAPNNPYRFASAGGDGKLRFWDTRMLSQPESLLELSGHSHWVWRAAYSPFHDQLLLSSSTDTTVCAWYLPALAKLKGAEPRQRQPSSSGGASRPGAYSSLRQEADGRAQLYDEHDESVYGLAWSPSDPWLFASLSYDGRLLVNKVPKNVKYKILI